MKNEILKIPMTFEIRQIDAWADGEGGWTWNESWHIADFSTQAKNEKRACIHALNKHGISFKRGRFIIDYDGSIYEVQDRKTHEPIFAFIPKT